MTKLFHCEGASGDQQVSTDQVACRTCQQPMVTRRRWKQLGRPGDLRKHATGGICTRCHDKARGWRRPSAKADPSKVEALLAEGGLTMDDIDRMLGPSGQDQPKTEGMTLLGEDADSHRAGPAQSARRSPGRAVPRSRLY